MTELPAPQAQIPIIRCGCGQKQIRVGFGADGVPFCKVCNGGFDRPTRRRIQAAFKKAMKHSVNRQPQIVHTIPKIAPPKLSIWQKTRAYFSYVVRG